jgi:hypothetical protein
MRFGYADPPYLGVAKKRYPEHPESWVYDTVEGHAELIGGLVAGFPDGWAYSLSARSLPQLLPLCPTDVHVMAWVKPWTSFRKNVNPAWAWEPVIVHGGRPRGSKVPTVRDWLSANAPHVNGKGFTGRKPESFCYWLFEVLGAQPDDEFVDLFPGSGAVGIAWEAWLGQLRMSA